MIFSMVIQRVAIKQKEKKPKNKLIEIKKRL